MERFAPVPGDVVLALGAEVGTVEAVYFCSEPSGANVTRWSWIVLTDGRLLEVAPRGCALYEPPRLYQHGSGPFLDLVAQDGALVRFEERVRAGTWEARPVRLSLDGRRWRVTSTGTVSAQRLGGVPASGWGQLKTAEAPAFLRTPQGLSQSPTSSPPTSSPASGRGRGDGSGLGDAWLVVASGTADARPAALADEFDVYFTLVSPNDPDVLGIGVWMTDVCLAFGRRLGATPTAAGLSIAETDQSPDAGSAG